MKLFYFNDEKIPVSIHLYDLCDYPYKLQPGEGKVFELELEDGSTIPFVKKWSNGVILISALTDETFYMIRTTHEVCKRDAKDIKEKRGF